MVQILTLYWTMDPDPGSIINREAAPPLRGNADFSKRGNFCAINHGLSFSSLSSPAQAALCAKAPIFISKEVLPKLSFDPKDFTAPH